MDIISQLREERAALVARVEQIDQMLKLYDEWGREAQRLLGLTKNTPAPTEAPHSSPLPAIKGVASGSIEFASHHRTKTPINEFEAAVISVLDERGVPMDRTALYDALLERGIVIGDGDRDKELNALSARVYRMAQDGRVENVRGQGYRLPTTNEAEPSVFG